MVAYVARPEDTDRQSPRYSRPHEPFRDPFGLVVASLHPVDEVVYPIILKVGSVVSPREDSIG